jgi:hypothetical protein
VVRRNIPLPSRRHLGHYRCLFADDGQTYTNDDPDPSNKIMGVYHKVATAALAWGISLDRWHNSITTMIEKQPGCPRINKLRVIHLYEADYNLLLKIIWARRLVWHAHDVNKLNEGQAGSRPGRNAIDISTIGSIPRRGIHAVRNTTTNDISHSKSNWRFKTIVLPHKHSPNTRHRTRELRVTCNMASCMQFVDGLPLQNRSWHDITRCTWNSYPTPENRQLRR